MPHRHAIIQCGSCGFYELAVIEVRGSPIAVPAEEHACQKCGSMPAIIAFYTAPRVPSAEEIARREAAKAKQKADRLAQKYGRRY